MPEKKPTRIDLFILILSTHDFDFKRIRLGLGNFLKIIY